MFVVKFIVIEINGQVYGSINIIVLCKHKLLGIDQNAIVLV